jgi:hypothetical protein
MDKSVLHVECLGDKQEKTEVVGSSATSREVHVFRGRGFKCYWS